MKKIKLAVTGLALSIFLAGCSAPTETGLRGSDKPYLTINGDKISQKDFYKHYDLFAQAQALNGQLASQVIDILQRDYVIKKDIKDNKIKVDEADYKKALDETIQNIGGEEAFNDYLKFMNTTKETFEENIRSNVDSNAHAKWYSENHKPTDAQLNEAYEQSKAQIDWIDTKHILAKTEEEAKKALEELKAGEDFAKVAEKYSIDETANKEGGNIGKNVVGNLDQAFVDGALKLKPGENSEPVKSMFGYHIINLNDKGVGVEANKEQLTQMVQSQMVEEYISKKITELEVKQFDSNGEEIVEELPEGDQKEMPEDIQEETPEEAPEETPEETPEEKPAN